VAERGGFEPAVTRGLPKDGEGWRIFLRDKLSIDSAEKIVAFRFTGEPAARN
jgi:hypothetical protein